MQLRSAMLERIWEYLTRNIKIAWKSVFFNFKQYCVFFAAIFIVQLLYGMMAISATNNNSVAFQQIKEEYDYHYVIRNLTLSQYNYLKDYKNADRGTFDELKQLYVIVDYDKRVNAKDEKEVYDVFLRFGKEGASDSLVQSYAEQFEADYLPVLSNIEGYSYKNYQEDATLLLEYSDRVASNNNTFWIITLLLIVLSVFLLMSIYNIRMNQYKFTYGVYMTFGADFKMLFGTAFWELFVIMLVTFIPAVVASTAIVYFIYAPSGFTFAFSALVFLQVFVFSLLVVLASVFMPMRITSMRQPMSLIVTEDNSNLVSSPRKSFNLLGKKFPLQYELYSIWRFRKYNIQLLTTAIIFCALFICGLYLANIYTTDLDYPRAQYQMELDLENTYVSYDSALSKDLNELNESFLKEYGDDFDGDFKALSGIETTGNATPTDGDLDVGQSPVTEAKYINSFMLVNKKDVKAFASGFFVYRTKDAYSPYQGEGSYKVTNDVLYKAVDPDNYQDLFDFLSQYTIEGDVKKILESNKDVQYVIVGDSKSNIKTYKFDVGDKIAVSTYKSAVTAVDSNLSGKSLLRRQIKNYEYTYTDLEVCAVIKDIPSGSVPVYMLNDTYEAVTGRAPTVTKLNLYTNPDLDDEHITFIEDEMRTMLIENNEGDIGAVSVKNMNTLAENNIKKDEHYNELYIAISILILCISPIIWFFSQTLYYFKREKEFNVIQSLGANGSDIRVIYLLGGLSMAVMSLIVSIALSYLGSYIMFYAYNVIVPNFSQEYVRYTFYMPWYALVISVIMSVACGFFSAYLPYRSYFKNRYSLENGGSGVEHDE